MRKKGFRSIPYYLGIFTFFLCLFFFKHLLVKTKEDKYEENLKENGIRRVNVTSSEAVNRLPKNGTIMCWIMTAEKNYLTKVPAVNSTWLPRCDHGQFFTTKPLNDSSIPYSTVFVGLDDSYKQLFFKSINAFFFAYTKISSNFEWYMKADDDTYVIMEHLKEYLAQFNWREPYYLGYTFDGNGGYHSGGAGYVLSNAAVKLLVEKAFPNRKICPYHEYEDVGIGQCLRNLGIIATKAPEAQNRFIPIPKLEAISEPDVITLHYQSPEDMKKLETFLYKVKSPQQSHFFQEKS